MNARFLTLAAALALAAVPASAQQVRPTAAPPGAAAAAVGHWLHDGRGQIIGSVRSLSPDGRTATIVLGIYKLDVVRLVEVPADALSVVDGKTTLRAETITALDARSGG